MIRALSISTLLCLAPSLVHASCVLGDPELLWSYPAEGERDVPLNATFWMLTTWTNVAQSTAWLNDAPLGTSTTPNEVGVAEVQHVRFRPRPLRADTDYTLRVRYEWPGTTQAHEFEVHFRTGRKKAKSNVAMEVVGRSELRPQDASVLACSELFGVQGCFDAIDVEHPPKVQCFETAGGSPIAWFLEADAGGGSLLWPAQCGEPALMVPFSRGDECFSLRAIGPGGLMSPVVQHCISKRDAPTHASINGFKNAGRALDKRQPRGWTPPMAPPVEPPPTAAEPLPVEPTKPAPPVAPATLPPSSGCALRADGGLSWTVLALLRRRAHNLLFASTVQRLLGWITRVALMPVKRET